MNQRDISRAIYLSGIKPIGYVVHHAIAGEEMELSVPSVGIGNAIVRALRERQSPNGRLIERLRQSTDSVRGMIR